MLNEVNFYPCLRHYLEPKKDSSGSINRGTFVNLCAVSHDANINYEVSSIFGSNPAFGSSPSLLQPARDASNVSGGSQYLSHQTSLRFMTKLPKMRFISEPGGQVYIFSLNVAL